MLPLVDLHCHLYAGLDDGPRTIDDALEMCRIAWSEGTRAVAATAHQNERWPGCTPDAIRAAALELRGHLQAAGLALQVYPTAEVMFRPDLIPAWERGELLSVGDRGAYLLLEMPHGLVVDVRHQLRELRRLRLRPILAHPERHPELLHEKGTIEALIELGGLVQVSSASLTHPAQPDDAAALRLWLRRGVVHLIGSDGHSPQRRPPRLADAYRAIAACAGGAMADRICSTNGLAVLEGLPLNVPAPTPPKRAWLSRRN